MKKLVFIFMLILPVSLPAHAGYELICQGYAPQTNHQAVFIDCNDRDAVVEILRTAWMEIRKNMGGTVEDVCWGGYTQAKDLQPALGMDAGMANTFFMQCNMGLGYLN